MLDAGYLMRKIAEAERRGLLYLVLGIEGLYDTF